MLIDCFQSYIQVGFLTKQASISFVGLPRFITPFIATPFHRTLNGRVDSFLLPCLFCFLLPYIFNALRPFFIITCTSYISVLWIATGWFYRGARRRKSTITLCSHGNLLLRFLKCHFQGLHFLSRLIYQSFLQDGSGFTSKYVIFAQENNSFDYLCSIMTTQ